MPPITPGFIVLIWKMGKRFIICMGDSLTEGSDLERATTWPSLVDSLAVSARHSKVPVADFYSPMTDHSGRADESFFLEDGLHPNRDGHRLMADSLVSVLKEEFYFQQRGRSRKVDY